MRECFSSTDFSTNCTEKGEVNIENKRKAGYSGKGDIAAFSLLRKNEIFENAPESEDYFTIFKNTRRDRITPAAQ